jgi:hypothetical protein
MSPVQLRILITGIFFLFIFLSGIWLNRSGRPYKSMILTIHKLISLGTIVYLVITIRRLIQAFGLSAIELTALVMTGLLFLGTMITGGILSIPKPMPKVVLKLHRMMPLLTVLFTALTLFLLIGCKS